MASPSPSPHVAIFPFMSKGHTIPLLHLAHLLHGRRLATLTFFTTPLNSPFIGRALAGTDASIIELPFPQNAPGLPPGVESTDSLPSMSLLLPFIAAVKLLQPHFEQVLQTLPTVSFLISDGFLGWTKDSAAKLGIPRIVSYGMGAFAITMCNIVARDRPHSALASDKDPFVVPGFPRLQLTKSDLCPPFDDPNPKGPLHEFVIEQLKARRESYGMVVNSFYELEATYVDYWNSNMKPKAWCVGPLCLARQEAGPAQSPELMEWLNSKSAVLYIAFGSQAQISTTQLQEIAVGLERSGLEFLWVVRAKDSHLGDGFEERVAERGRVVREWVDQMGILRHESVKGFLSHCGWNSVMEAVSAGVPVLAWPMMADQHLNAKLMVEELGMGLRVRASDGSRNGLVTAEVVEVMVMELLMGRKGREAADKAVALAEEARKATDGGGSSVHTLELMIDEICGKRTAH